MRSRSRRRVRSRGHQASQPLQGRHPVSTPPPTRWALGLIGTGSPFPTPVVMVGYSGFSPARAGSCRLCLPQDWELVPHTRVVFGFWRWSRGVGAVPLGHSVGRGHDPFPCSLPRDASRQEGQGICRLMALGDGETSLGAGRFREKVSDRRPSTARSLPAGTRGHRCSCRSGFIPLPALGSAARR